VANYSCIGGSCTNCTVTGSSSYVDPVNGSDDTAHGGSTGQCAFRTIRFALMHTSGTVNLLSNGNYNSETYPLALSGSQALSCGGATLSSSNVIINLNGPNTGLYNCVIAGGGKSGSNNCVDVASGLSTGTITISGCTIHDCPLGVAMNGSGTLSASGNTIYNVTNGLNSLGNATITNNQFYGCGDAINGCATGTAVNGSGNNCSVSMCSIGCNGCDSSPTCYVDSFWTRTNGAYCE
jgi:hypothetical protein